MPTLWKIGLVVLIVCLVLSMAIAIVRLVTTPTEIVGGGFQGLHAPHGHVRNGDAHDGRGRQGAR